MTRKLKVVLVGCGGISAAWLSTSTVQKRVEVVGLVDLRRKAAEARKRQFGLSGAATFTDVDEALSTLDPEAVFDCTVPAAHSKVTLAALAHGCHVLGEKPLASTMAEARRMVAAAKKARRIYAVIQNRRYQDEIRALRTFIASGTIGKVTTVQSNFFIGAHFGGFRDRMEHVLLVDMAIHTFDAARFLTVADAKAVYCHEWNPAASWYDHDASAVAIFEMSGGIVYVYQGSWCSEGCRTSWEAQWRIVGTKGTVLWDGASGITAEASSGEAGFFRPMKALKVPVRKLPRKGHDGAIGEFVDCVTRGGVPETVSSDNIKSLAMVHAAVESARAQKRITVRP
jgi:predicted dehydrogenase